MERRDDNAARRNGIRRYSFLRLVALSDQGFYHCISQSARRNDEVNS